MLFLIIVLGIMLRWFWRLLGLPLAFDDDIRNVVVISHLLSLLMRDGARCADLMEDNERRRRRHPRATGSRQGPAPESRDARSLPDPEARM